MDMLRESWVQTYPDGSARYPYEPLSQLELPKQADLRLQSEEIQPIEWSLEVQVVTRKGKFTMESVQWIPLRRPNTVPGTFFLWGMAKTLELNLG